MPVSRTNNVVADPPEGGAEDVGSGGADSAATAPVLSAYFRKCVVDRCHDAPSVRERTCVATACQSASIALMTSVLEVKHDLQSVMDRLRAAIEGALEGKPEAVELSMICLMASGHLLIEDVPGVGKTTLARALAKAVGGEFRRVQFTSDLLPSDVLGVSVYDQARNRFEFKQGPVFANMLLADEINRASPRTQSALLEAMNEGQVSIDGHSSLLPQPKTPKTLRALTRCQNHSWTGS